MALLEEGVASIVVSEGECRIELDRLVVIRDGAIQFTPEAVDAATIVPGAGIGRIRIDRFVQARERRVEFAFLGQLMTADAVSGREPASSFGLRADHFGAGAKTLCPGVDRRDAGFPGWRVFGVG